jgi:hypothetical protein
MTSRVQLKLLAESDSGRLRGRIFRNDEWKGEVIIMSSEQEKILLSSIQNFLIEMSNIESRSERLDEAIILLREEKRDLVEWLNH